MSTRRTSRSRGVGFMRLIGSAAVGVAISAAGTAAHAGPFGFTRIVNTAVTTPPSEPATAQYDFVGIPSYNAGQIVFGSMLFGDTVGGAGLYTRIDSSTKTAVLTRIAKQDLSFNNNATRFFFDDPVVSGGKIAVRTSAYDSSVNAARTRIFTFSGGTFTTSVIAAGPAALYNGSLAFGSNLSAGNSTLLNGTLVDTNRFVPGGGGAKFQSFTPLGSNYPDYNGEYAAFYGRWTDSSNVSRVGLYRWQRSTDGIVAVADRNVTIPNFPLDAFDDNFAFRTTNFDNVSTTGETTSSRASLAGSMVAFSYDEVLSAPPRAGAYRYANGVLSKIADVSTASPSFPNTVFRYFEGVSTVGTATAFVANAVAGNQSRSDGPEIGSGHGIYMEMCGTIREVIRPGQVLDGRIVQNLELGHRGLTTSKFAYDLAFRAEFTDGSEGIYISTTSSLCYTPVAVLDITPFLNGASFATVPANPDVGVPLDSTWTMRTIQGGVIKPATFHADFQGDRFGVNGLPGNNPSLIDYTLVGGQVAVEEIELSFDQEILLQGAHFQGVDTADSLQMEVGGLVLNLKSADVPDGIVSLPDLRLGVGELLRIRWDPGNTLGDGFSVNGIMYQVIPEPGLIGWSAMSMMLLSGRRRSRAKSCHSA
jgi:hypothetical protein